ncbi:U3 small nucleolar RNA-associated protein 6-domain-containing protein [Cristinia sonorae]|uniref:U3 small nucleolar RNA-associated protein 6-domain-containing protein n=1 Tax=Cristinia sonorae TaxID=1940300 RepID=A0A8K0V0N7_9AGAR|nr:U3 small nucleolar RNA-associated protein 6-domain-containing protein [Cristinia sonorae]
MERVQYQQEQMLAELKDLVEKGLFTESEIKQVMKKRTAFETALIRRIAKKGDFLRYISYEMGLEALRRKRAERLKSSSGSPSISDYALVRRQFHIFERALKKFKSDIGLWIQYIQVAKKEGARSLVGRITARAMKLHPNVPAFYILAASHELEHLSPSAARILLQRGIRLNADSVEMWKEYVKMELGFIEGLRRRWEVLGIKVDLKGKGKEQANSVEGDVENMEVPDIEEDSAEAARREIMQGAIVRTVIANAAKALPKADLFIALSDLLTSYPSPEALKTSLLDYLHQLLQETLPGDPRAIRLTATRFLPPTVDIESAEFVDALRNANEKLMSGVRDAWSNTSGSDTEQERRRHDMAGVYAQFVREWCQKNIDLNLKLYLNTSLHGLIRKLTSESSESSKPCAPMLATHISVISSLSALTPPPLSLPDILTLGRKYTSLPAVDTSAEVWLARLDASKQLADNTATRSQIRTIWNEAREHVRGEGAIDVWLWGLEHATTPEELQSTLKELLNESIRIRDSPSFSEVHETLLGRYSSTAFSQESSDMQLLSLVRFIKQSYLPTARTWRHLFSLLESATSPPTKATQETYHHWTQLDPVESTAKYAGWLFKHNRAQDALNIVQGVRGEEVKEEVARLWRELLSEKEARSGKAEEEDDQMVVDS